MTMSDLTVFMIGIGIYTVAIVVWAALHDFWRNDDE